MMAQQRATEIALRTSEQRFQLALRVGGMGAWQLIASAKSFVAGTSGFVQLANNTGETTRRVAADAVRWAWSDTQATPPAIAPAKTTTMMATGR